MFRLKKRESEIPRCPFCQTPFGRLTNQAQGRRENFFKWTCACGALGIFDATGNTMGEAMLEGLLLACGEDWEKAAALEADRDYEVKFLEGYSRHEHRVLGLQRTYKSGFGAFVFIRLLPEIGT